MDTEEYFPRGKIANATEIKPFSVHTNFLFDTNKRKNSTSEYDNVKRTRLNEKSSNEFVLEINYSTIEVGMTLLACVRSITTLSIEVELPGKMSGKIKITSISDPLTKLLRQKALGTLTDDCAQLDKMFSIGQFIPTKVLSKETTGKGTELALSMSPTDLHRTWSYDKFRKGCVIWTAIESRQDHGYQLDVGNGDCRIFLPDKNVGSGMTYGIGQPLWCVVKKSTILGDTITLVVSPLDGQTKLTDDAEAFNLIPGTPVSFTVSKVVSGGLIGTYLKQTKGCIHEGYLKTPLEDLSETSSGDKFKAYVLHVHPVTKQTHFTLRPTLTAASKHKNGPVLTCQFVKRTKMGILLRLADGAVGFVARKRLDMLSLDDVPSKCRILDYRHLEQLYICSFDTDAPDKTDETDNLKIGQTVRATISGINSKGIALKLGKVGGFIQNVHLADEPYDNEVKERFKVGDVISAKVWNINEGGVYFTCKEALLDKEVGPMSLEDFEINKPYPGVVVNKSKKGIMVVFFGDVRGILFKDYLNRIFGNQWQDAMYEGEVVLPVVEKMENGILRLKFSVPEVHSVARPLNVGEYVAAQVTQNIPQGLHITIPRKNQKGFIPVAHLSCSLSLTPQLLDTYNVGDDLDDLMCVSADDKTFSVREGRRFKLRGAQVPSSSDVRVGSLLRCSYLKSYNQRVCVSALVAPKPMLLNLYNNEMDVESNRKFASQQGITVRVTRINNDRKRIKVSARTTDVYDWSLEDAVYELEQYVSDIRRIQERSSHVTKCCLGQQVDCTVKTVAKDYATVTVEGDVEGIVVKHHCLAKMEVGAEVRGLVLWVDVQKNLMIISLKMDQLNFKHDSKAHLNTSTEASVLYFNDDFAMVITKSNHAIFIPMLSNNKFLMVGQYKPNQKVNVIVKRIVNGMAVGIDEAIFKRFSSKQKVAPSVEKVIKSEDEEPVDGNVSSSEEESDNDEKEISPANENSQRKTVAPTLPGLDNFFSAPKVVESESSSDEEVPRERKSKKKKKLTAAERTEMIRHNEEKIRAKEIELADASLEPDSEERFERLVAGNPNSSELWAKYIAYCVSNAEIQKARTIARHALKRIDLNETVERYNVWITLLNLENSYGDKDSFNAAFEEAARCNDDLQIYLDVIDLFANSKRYSEMNEKIKKMKTKHKTDPKMWTGIARVYYKCGHLQDARNVHSSALKTVHSKADHVDLVVQFAVMEFKYGEKHHAEALFETVLQENPKRVDVWSTYVDQMVKKDNIEGARRVLERAVCNSIPPKKMKILFKKFKELELKFGNEESVQHVIELAKQYLGNKL